MSPRAPKETHLLTGLFLQILVVTLLVFAYTQAARQMNFQRRQHRELLEQLTHAREQMMRMGQPDLPWLKASWDRTASRFVPLDALEGWSQQLKQLAQDRFGFEDLTVRVGETFPRTLQVPFDGSQLEVELATLELKGQASSREAAAFLRSLTQFSAAPLCSLYTMEIRSPQVEGSQDAQVDLAWIVPTFRKPVEGGKFPIPSSWNLAQEPLVSPEELDWGSRQEPFLK